MVHRARIEVGRMTERQLWERLVTDTHELEHSIVNQADVARRKALPLEMRMIVAELRQRGSQQSLLGS